eukprot:1146914-Pelagomonas_calceolata.AAC.10
MYCAQAALAFTEAFPVLCSRVASAPPPGSSLSRYGPGAMGGSGRFGGMMGGARGGLGSSTAGLGGVAGLGACAYFNFMTWILAGAMRPGSSLYVFCAFSRHAAPFWHAHPAAAGTYLGAALEMEQ